MYKFALIGHPLTQSVSPAIHKAALKDTGLEGDYVLMDLHPEELVSGIKKLRTQGFSGFNVTIPHKVPITFFLAQYDELANITGCANTVKILDDKSLYGYNTDLYGFLAAIPDEIKQKIKGSKCTILGTGGAARTVAISLVGLGAAEIDIFTRNPLNATDLVKFLRNQFPTVKFNLVSYQNLNSFSNTYMLVNTTPIGMRGKSMGVSPVDEFFLQTMKKFSVVYDIVYNPLNTELLKLANKNGLYVINGLDMLVFQAQKAFEIWTGRTPDPKALKIAALEALST